MKSQTCFSNTRGAQEQHSKRFIFFIIDQKIHLDSVSDRFRPVSTQGFGSLEKLGWVLSELGLGLLSLWCVFLCFRFSIKMTIKCVFEMTCLKLNFKSSNR